MVIPQILTPISFLLGMGVVNARRGAFAWNGAITFWIVSFGFLAQIWVDTYGLFIATLTPALEGEPLSESVCVSSVSTQSLATGSTADWARCSPFVGCSMQMRSRFPRFLYPVYIELQLY